MSNWQAIITGLTSETDYNNRISVVAVNASGDSLPATVTSGAITASYDAPGDPSLVPGSVTDTGYQLSFATVTGSPDGYKAYLNDTTEIGSSTTSPMTITGRTPGTQDVNIHIRAYDAVGEGASSTNGVSVSLAPTAITASAPTADQISGTSFKITFTGGTAVPTPTYTVLDNGSPIGVTTLSAPGELTVTGLTAQTTYSTVAIRATSVDGGVTTSSTISVTTSFAAPTPAQADGAPEGISYSAVTTTGYKVYFTTVAGATGYRAYVNGGGITGSIGESTTSPITVTGRTPGNQDAGVVVRAYSTSEGDACVIGDIALLPETSLPAIVPGSVTSTQCKVTFPTAIGANQYQLYDNVTGSFIAVASATSPNTEYTVSGSAGSVHGFRVETQSAYSAINNSAITSVTFASEAMTIANLQLQAGSITATTFTVDFTLPTGAAYFKLQIDGVLQPTQYSISPAVVTFPNPGHTATDIKAIAYTANGDASPLSDVLIASVTPAAPASAPASIGTITPHETTFDITMWDTTVAGAYFYKVFVDGVEYATTFTSVPANGIPFQQYATTTTVGVAACNDGGCSTPITATVTPLQPSTAPVPNGAQDNLIPVAIGGTLSWGSVTNAASYNVEISPDTVVDGNGSLTNKVVSVNVAAPATSLEITAAMGLLSGHKYYWHVQSVNVSGVSGWSSPLYSFLLALPKPVIAYPENGATGLPLNFTVDWSPYAFTKTPGDLAIVQVDTAADTFTVVALTDIPASATIMWTDKGWKAVGGFYASELSPTPISHTGIAKGTCITVNAAAAGAALSGIDQIFLLCGSPTATTVEDAKFLYGLDFGSAGWDADATTTATSALPSTLAQANVSLGSATSWGYAGSMSAASKGVLLGMINNPANWTSGVATWSRGNFTVVDDGIPDKYDWQIDENGSYMDSGVDLSATSLAVSGLTTDTQYSFKVRGKNTATGAISEYSDIVTFSTFAEKPGAFDLLTPAADAVNLNPKSVIFSWGTPSGLVEHYDIVLDSVTPPVGPPMQEVPSGQTSWTWSAGSGNTMLIPAVTYYWRVKATNAAGTTDSTSIRSFTTGTVAPALTEVVNDASSPTGGKLNVSWTMEDTTGVTGYIIKYGTASGTYTNTVAVAAGNLSGSITGLINGTPYYVAVVSHKADNAESDASNELSGTPSDVSVPSPVTGASAVPVASGSAVQLTWTNPTVDFSRVVIVRKTGGVAPTDPTDGTVILDSTTATSYLDEGNP